MDNKELNDLEALELSAENLEDVAGGKLDKKFLSSTMAGITLLTGSPNFSNTKAASSSLSGSDFSTQISAKVEKEEKQEKQEVKPKSESKVNESKSIMKVDYDYDAKTGKLIINKVFKDEVTRSAIEDILTAEDIKADDIKKIEIKDGVKALGNCCFGDFKNLENVKLPKDIEKIGAYAFANCDKLKKILLPKSVKEIGKLALGRSNIIMYDSNIEVVGSQRQLLEDKVIFDRAAKNITVTIIDTGSGNIKKLKKQIKQKVRTKWWSKLIVGLGLFVDFMFWLQEGSLKINVISEKEFLKNKASYL